MAIVFQVDCQIKFVFLRTVNQTILLMLVQKI